MPRAPFDNVCVNVLQGLGKRDERVFGESAKEEFLNKRDVASSCVRKCRSSAVRHCYFGAASVVCYWLCCCQSALGHSSHLVRGAASFPPDLSRKSLYSEPLTGSLVKLAQDVVVR
jgi:hypothetical protein